MMTAAVFQKPGVMTLQQVPRPEIGADELLLEVGACAVCGTDIRIFKGEKTKGVRTPSILGHEIAGRIAAVGSKVAGIEVGERIAIAPVLPCGKCYYCLNGKENACLQRRALGYEFDGGFAEFMRLPAAYLEKGSIFRFPEQLSFQEACLAEPLGCVYNGSRRCAIKLNDKVVIIGAGPIGLMHTMLARRKGATRIIVSEPLPRRRELALEVGADIAVDPGQADLRKIVLAETQGLGADAVILSVGVAAQAGPALMLLRKGGILNLFGGFPAGQKTEIDPNVIHYEEVWVTGTTACTRSQYGKALELISSGELDLKPIISHVYRLKDILEAFQTVAKGEGIKAIVQPGS